MPADRPVVLITGASSGFGLACAVHLASLGHRVYGAARTITPQTAAGITALRMDVTDEQSVTSGCDTILEQAGRLDVLVNSAGSGLAGPLECTSIEEARAQLDVNLLGVLRTCRAVLPAMRKQGGGTIINIGSIAGLVAVPYQGIYSASKFALEGFTEALRLEVKRFGIRVVLIEPGDHQTGFTSKRVATKESALTSPYGETCRRAIERMERDEQQGPGPEPVARLVARIIATRNPRLRYTIGPLNQRAAVWLKRLAPHRLVERLISDYYGV